MQRAARAVAVLPGGSRETARASSPIRPGMWAARARGPTGCVRAAPAGPGWWHVHGTAHLPAVTHRFAQPADTTCHTRSCGASAFQLDQHAVDALQWVRQHQADRLARRAGRQKLLPCRSATPRSVRHAMCTPRPWNSAMIGSGSASRWMRWVVGGWFARDQSAFRVHARVEMSARSPRGPALRSTRMLCMPSIGLPTSTVRTPGGPASGPISAAGQVAVMRTAGPAPRPGTQQ